MKNRITHCFPSPNIPSGKEFSYEIRLIRMNAIGMVKSENLSPGEKRRVIDLLLGRNGALTDRELERLHKKLVRKAAKQ